MIGVKKQKSLNKLKHLTVAYLTNKSGTVIYDYQTSNMGSNSIKSIKYKDVDKKDLKIMKSMDASCHAETGLLKRHFRHFSKNNKKISMNKFCLVIERYNKSGELVNAKPCMVCCAPIRISGIKDVWYSKDDGTHQVVDGRTITGEPSSGSRMIDDKL